MEVVGSLSNQHNPNVQPCLASDNAFQPWSALTAAMLFQLASTPAPSSSYLTGHIVTKAKDRGWDKLTNGVTTWSRSVYCGGWESSRSSNSSIARLIRCRASLGRRRSCS